MKLMAYLIAAALSVLWPVTVALGLIIIEG